MVKASRPAISVIMIVGTNRENAQGVLDALGRQSCADDLFEIVVFDSAESSVPALEMPTRLASKYLRRSGLHFWGVARAQAARESSAPIVAFLEDHCEPHATWAERLLEAHSDGRWAAVGYAFTNGSRDSLWSRSALLADYGFFVHPVEGGPARILAGNNVSYFCKRARRIFPGFWVCLVVTAFVIAPAIWLVKGEPIAEFPWTGPQSASSYVTSNFFLRINQHTVGASIAGLAWPESINGSLWTLYLELGCYFVAAVFLVGGALRESRWLVGGALCASFLYHVLKLVVGDEAFHIVPAFYSFKNWSPYLTAFAAGAAAYAWREKLTFSFGTVCVLALECAMTLRYGGFNIISPLMVPALLLCAGSCFNVRLEKDFSYGIYIYSFPLQQLLFALGVADLPVSVFFLASLVLSVGCAWLSWHWVERPALGRPA